MKILALDPSLTCIGVVRAGEIGSLTSKLKGIERVIGYRDALIPWIASADIVVAEEQPKHGRQQSGVIGRAELYGVLRATCYDMGVPFLELNPSTVKKFATGRGNAPKPEVFSAAIRRLQYEGTSEDEADALWIWWLAVYALDDFEPRTHSNNPLKLPQAHLQAVDVAKKALSDFRPPNE